MCGKANGFVAADAPRSLHELIEETLRISCADGLIPTVRRLCFGARWAVVELSDGRAGRAFTFNGQHAVYGALDFEYMKSLQSLTGVHADDAVAQLLDEGVHGITSGAVDNAAYCSLRRSVALAVANALSCEVNAPEALAERGFAVSDPSDRSFFRSDDAVVLVGAGMLLREAAAMCASLDVVDLRPRAALQSVLLDADGVRIGPGTVRFHGVEDTAALVAQADVVGITGCALENDSLFDIARLPRRAREFVVFGPSAQAPMELFAALGATRVLASRIVDADALIEGMLEAFDAAGPRSATEGSVVTMPEQGRE